MNWEWYIPAIAGIVNVCYGVVMHILGPTSSIRRRGLEHIYDTLIAFIIFSIFLIFFENLQYFIHVLARSLGLDTRYIDGKSTIDVLDSASKYFLDSFNNVKNMLTTLYIVCMTLNIVPYTVPAAYYLSQSTQYLQWMAHWALINLYMYYVLSKIGVNCIAISGIGFGLLVPRQTRSIGALLTALSIVLPAQVEMIYLWEVNNEVHIVLPHSINISNALKIARDIALGGYEIAKALQEQNIIMDIASAISGVLIFTITKIIDETGHYLKI